MDREIIQQVELNSILYDKSSKDFKNSKKKLQIWEEIALFLNTTADIVQRRWKVLRDRYAKERRDRLYIPSGAASTENEWEYFKAMSFLEPFVRSRKTFSNVEIGDNSNSSGSPLELEVLVEEHEVLSLSPSSVSHTISPFESNVFTEEDEQEIPITTPSSSRSTPSPLTPTPSPSTSAQSPSTHTPSPSTPAQSPSTPATKLKRRREEVLSVDDAISSVASYFKNKSAVDSDLAYGQYVGAELQKLSKRKKNVAKIKIAQVFNELDSD